MFLISGLLFIFMPLPASAQLPVPPNSCNINMNLTICNQELKIVFCLLGYVTNNKISRCTTTGVMPNTQISSILLLVKVDAQLTKAKKYMSVSPNSKKTERVSKYANFYSITV